MLPVLASLGPSLESDHHFTGVLHKMFIEFYKTQLHWSLMFGPKLEFVPCFRLSGNVSCHWEFRTWKEYNNVLTNFTLSLAIEPKCHSNDIHK